MLGFIGNVVQGGWDAVGNVVGTIGKGASSLISGFFPAEQRQRVEHLEIEPAEQTGLPFRVTDPDSSSMFETFAMRADDWVGSSYEEQFSIPAKRQESQALDSFVTSKSQDGFDKMLEDVYKFGTGVAEKAEKITTLADHFYDLGIKFGIIKPRETIIEVPRVGYPEGQNAQHTSIDKIKQAGQNVLETIKGAGAAMLGQLKGLFNLGYEAPEGRQPVFSIAHEIQPTPKLSIGLIVAVAAIILTIILTRKK